MGRRYGFDRDYTHNVFGADEHLRVTLFKLSKDGKRWVPVQDWSYSTFMQERIANARAERRIKKLRSVYGAEAI